MNHSVSKYQQLIATVLFVAYLVANLSLPIFEGIHFLLHLSDDTSIHSFQSHNNQHQHKVLDMVNQLTNNDSPSPLPIESTKDQKLKKIVQQLVMVHPLTISIKQEQSANYYTYEMIYAAPFLPLFAPPPEV